MTSTAQVETPLLSEEDLDYVMPIEEHRRKRERQAPGPIPSECSEDKLALRFSERYAAELRYTNEWGQWHRKVGSRWEQDTTLDVFSKARVLCREAALTQERRSRPAIESAHTIAAVEKLARCDPRHVARPEEWDADPYALGTPDGIVDLQAGTVRPATPSDFLTKQATVTPSIGKCSRWLAFLDWATGGDSDTLSFLQRMAGYCATGDTREHAMFFAYGVGGNGKGTAVNTVHNILGDYARVAPMETFTESRGERHPTEVAMLRGARLVTSQETEQGRRWAESRIKTLTGGDAISARYMRQDFFQFVPQFKLVVVGNHKPSLNSVDEAIRRRFFLLPFEQIISRDDRDEFLADKLREEWPAILHWMIEGCSLWLADGLRPPERVLAATKAYFEEQDSFAAWIYECCTVKRGQWDSSANLFQSWCTWAERAGEKPGTMKAFSSELQKKGYVKVESGHSKTRGYAGLSVRTDTANAYQKDR